MSEYSISEKPIVVIAEDSRTQARYLQQRLTNAGYDAHVGFNGELALELVRQYMPDIVVSDIEMPKMTGYELCKAIKSDPALRHIPVVLLSTLADAEDIIRGLDVGADNYVTKPYDPNYLLGRVESLLSTPTIDSVDEETSTELPVTLHGVTYRVKAGRQQTLNLLISIFENAVEKNRELQTSNEQLTITKEKLTVQNAKLESLNLQLEEINHRMSHDLEAAARIQKSLLPPPDFSVPGLNLYWKYTPCEELAGDFLNCFQLDEDHLAMFVVDVSGHGAASSLLAVAIGRSLMPSASAASILVRLDPFTNRPVITTPGTVLAELNRRFQMESQGGLHFTIIYGVLNLKSLVFRYSNAGHPQPVVTSLGEPSRFLPGDGVAIGWVEDMEFDDEMVQLKPGDRLYLYSDGVPEAMNSDMEELTNDRMMAVLDTCGDKTISESVELLSETVTEWCVPKGPRDDVSILAFEMPNPETDA